MSRRNIAARKSSSRSNRRSARKAASIASASFEALEQRQLMSTITVTNANDAGAGSLRQAILAANAASNPDTIVFASTTDIFLASPLPTITQPLTIDGSSVSVPTNSQVILSGGSAGTAHGLAINSNDVTIRALNIRFFHGDGIVIFGGTNNHIAGCFIGTNNVGGGAQSNDGNGIRIHSAGNTIGGLAADDRNIISGNGGNGILVRGSFSTGTGNVIVGNRIGIGADGTTQIANGGHGIALESSGNRVGAATAAQGGAAARNIISGNGGDGVHIERTIDFIIGFAGGSYDFGPPADDNVVAGNYIGTAVNGIGAVRNDGHGVRIVNGLRNVIGSAEAVGRNIISGNRLRGVDITQNSKNGLVGSSTDNLIIGNYIGLAVNGEPTPNLRSGVAISSSFVSGNRVGGSMAGERNVISSNGAAGVAIQAGAAANLVQGNYIGTDPTGTEARPNFEAGVFIGDSQGNTVGGRFTSQRNIISGNDDDGVRILSTDAAFTPANSNLVYNNYIGTNAAGTAALPNTLYGVRIIGGSTNQIGNTFIDTGNAGNLISGNGLAGVGIGIDTPDFTEIGTTASNSIVNNSIGTNAAGTAPITNVGGGMSLNGTAAVPTTSTFVGGANNGTLRRGNVIVSDQLHLGVIVSGGAVDTSLLGNRIGTNSAGTAILGNIGNPMIVNGPGTIIGSAAAGTGNVIGGGVTPGILISTGATDVTIAGNSIGTDPGGTINLGNLGAGIYINYGSNFGTANTTIGGTTTAAENRIAFNGSGISIETGRDVEILHNRIYSNNGLGVDLGVNGITPNDAGDGDSGPNSYQNFPVLSAVSQAAANVTIPTALNSIVSTTFRIDYYAVINPNSSSSGASDFYLGSADVTTNASGNASVTPTFSLAGAPGAQAVTATARRQGTFNDTSEFAANRAIVPLQAFGIWDGGGDSVNWTDANNWTNNTLPTATDDVFIQTPGTFTVNNPNALTIVNSLTLGDNAGSTPTLSIAANGTHVLKTGTLAINGSAKLDLNDNDLILDYTGASQLPAVQAKINAARNGGLWNGSGITSATAAGNPLHNTTLGAISGAEYDALYGVAATFAGQSVDATSVLVKYTYYGDTDFNGTVNFDDYSRTDAGFNGTGTTGWLNGDFDGNGSVNFDDYSLIDLAFNTQGSGLRPGGGKGKRV